MAKKYYYSVEYGGVGDPPIESVDLGHCSQIAVFTRSQIQPEDVIEKPYQLVCQILICNIYLLKSYRLWNIVIHLLNRNLAMKKKCLGK